MRDLLSITSVARWIDSAGVVAIVGGGIAAIVLAVIRTLRRSGLDAYRAFRRDLGRAIIIGLELLVAADIVHTIDESPTPLDLAELAAIIAIRTGLSFTLAVELDGRWPWQRAETADSPPVRPVPAGENGDRSGS